MSSIVIVNISALGAVDSRSNTAILTGFILYYAVLTSLSLLFCVAVVVVLLPRVFSTLIGCRGRETAGAILRRLRIFVICSGFSNNSSSFNYSLVLDSSF
jgi:membrane glycosyltransferase